MSKNITKTVSDNLIGLYGYLLEHQTFEVKYQFEIVSRLNETLYLVKLFSALDGHHKGDMMIVTLHNLHDYHRCRLYSNHDRWVEQAEELDRQAAARKAAQQQPFLKWEAESNANP